VRRINPGDRLDGLPTPWWAGEVSPRDRAHATRMHEAAHAVAYEALWIPVKTLDANSQVLPPDHPLAKDVPEVGGIVETEPGNAQLVTIASLLGAPAEEQAMRELGYDDPDLLHNVMWIGGSGDRLLVNRILDAGHAVDVDRAYEDGLALLQEHHFDQTVRNVAEALQTHGDRLTGYELRKVIGEDLPVERAIWVPDGYQPNHDLLRRTRADDLARAVIESQPLAREREPPSPAAPEIERIEHDDDFDIAL
jgi:hypothetical protein